MALDFSFKSQFPIAQMVQIMQQKAVQQQQMDMAAQQNKRAQMDQLLNTLTSSASLARNIKGIGADKLAMQNASLKNQQLQREMDAQQKLSAYFNRPQQSAQVTSPIQQYGKTQLSAPGMSDMESPNPQVPLYPQRSVQPSFGQTAQYNPDTGSLTPNTEDNLKKQMQGSLAQMPGIPELLAKQQFPSAAASNKNATMFLNDAGQAVMVTPDESGMFNPPPGFQESSIKKADVWTKPRAEANIIREKQFDETQWNKLGKTVNSLTAPSRSALGMAAVGNQRAARALELLDNPKMDTVLKKYVEADLAGIMQGGAPHEQMLRQQGYENLATQWANIKQKITSEPQAIQVPEVRQQLKDTILGIMAVDNEVLDTNVGIAKEQFLKAIQNDPKRFERMVGVTQNIKTIGTKQKGSSSLPQVGQMFNGGKVLSIKRIGD